MATPLRNDPPGSNPPPLHEPLARFWHCSVLIEGKLYTYGGRYGVAGTPATPPTVIEVLDLATDRWQQQHTLGTPPPGFIGVACVAVGMHLYTFGGYNTGNYFNTIHDLNTRTLTWSEVQPINPGEAPMAKCGAAMICYAGKILVTFGGYGVLPSPLLCHPGAQYISSKKFGRYGWTNELCCFDSYLSMLTSYFSMDV